MKRTILVLTLLALILASTFYSCAVGAPSGLSGFNTRRWSKTDKNGYPVHRLAMWGEVDNHLRTGMNLDEVTELLGGGDPVDPELERLYPPGSRFWELGEGHVLVVRFSEEGTVGAIDSTRWPPLYAPVEIPSDTLKNDREDEVEK